MAPTTALYDQLQSEEDGEASAAKITAPSLGIWLAHALLLATSLSCLVLSYLLTRPHMTSTWSTPGFDHFARRDVRFVGSFRSESPYRGPPSPEVDDAWERFTVNPWIDGTAVILGIGHAEVVHAKKDTEDEWYNTTVKLSDGTGGGMMATLEMFHQLHCLDLIRRFSHYDYYKDRGGVFSTSQDDQRNHIDHCIEIIRQVIMCNGDTNLITWHWVKNKPNPYPDFNVWHSCRDPEEILASAKKREALIKDRAQLQKKNNGNVVEMPNAP